MARTFQVNLNDGLYRGETATPEQIVADHPFCMGIWFKSVSTTTQKPYFGMEMLLMIIILN